MTALHFEKKFLEPPLSELKAVSDFLSSQPFGTNIEHSDIQLAINGVGITVHTDSIFSRDRLEKLFLVYGFQLNGSTESQPLRWNRGGSEENVADQRLLQEAAA